jgi:hypothetical protein
LGVSYDCLVWYWVCELNWGVGGVGRQAYLWRGIGGSCKGEGRRTA